MLRSPPRARRNARNESRVTRLSFESDDLIRPDLALMATRIVVVASVRTVLAAVRAAVVAAAIVVAAAVLLHIGARMVVDLAVLTPVLAALQVIFLPAVVIALLRLRMVRLRLVRAPMGTAMRPVAAAAAVRLAVRGALVLGVRPRLIGGFVGMASGALLVSALSHCCSPMSQIERAVDFPARVPLQNTGDA